MLKTNNFVNLVDPAEANSIDGLQSSMESVVKDMASGGILQQQQIKNSLTAENSNTITAAAIDCQKQEWIHHIQHL